MHFMKPIPILILSILPGTMVDRFVLLAPIEKGIVDVVVICIDQAPLGHGLGDQRPDGDMLELGSI